MFAFGDGHTSDCSDQIAIIAHGGLGVCDGAHGSFVMKKVNAPAQRKPSLSTVGRATSQTREVAHPKFVTLHEDGLCSGAEVGHPPDSRRTKLPQERAEDVDAATENREHHKKCKHYRCRGTQHSGMVRLHYLFHSDS
jgi:hypothetical protein